MLKQRVLGTSVERGREIIHEASNILAIDSRSPTYLPRYVPQIGGSLPYSVLQGLVHSLLL